MGKIIYNGDVFGGAMTNMRYNPETDMVEIYYNGVWKEWKSGNMQTVYLYRDGEQIVALDNTGSYQYTSSYPSQGLWVLNPDNISATYGGSSSGVYAFVTDEVFDFANYSKLCVEVDHGGSTYTLEMSTNGIGNAYLVISLVYGTNFIFRIGLSSTKNNWGTNKFVIKDGASGTTSAYRTAYVRKIWVE